MHWYTHAIHILNEEYGRFRSQISNYKLLDSYEQQTAVGSFMEPNELTTNFVYALLFVLFDWVPSAENQISRSEKRIKCQWEVDISGVIWNRRVAVNITNKSVK